jgi:Cu/Ag efflux protein CusF
MQRGLRITLAVAVAAGAVALGAGTAFADDATNVVNIDQSPGAGQVKKVDDAAKGVTKKVQAPKLDDNPLGSALKH